MILGLVLFFHALNMKYCIGHIAVKCWEHSFCQKQPFTSVFLLLKNKQQQQWNTIQAAIAYDDDSAPNGW